MLLCFVILNIITIFVNIKNRNKMKKKVEEAMTVEGIMEEYEVNRRLAMYVLEERIARQKDKE